MIRISNLILLLVVINVSNSDYLKTAERIRIGEVDWEEIILSLRENNETENECLESFKNYGKGLATGQEWALYMLDSSSKIPDGILKGSTSSLGNFDECIGAVNENFTGQFCMADITIEMPTGSKTKYTTSMFPHSNAAPLAESLTLNLHYGVCVPSTCTAEHLTTIINNTLSSSGKLNLIKNFSFNETNCETAKSKELSTGFWIVIAFIIVVIIIALASTSYEVHCIKNKNKPHPLLTSFSLLQNGKFLFKISNGDGQMLSLHGMRSLSIAWVVLGHAYFNNLFAPIINSRDILDIVQDINHIFIINALVSVDSFFLLSGLLVCFVFFRDVGKKGGYDVLLGYIHRYLRLTPLYALMILIVVTIFEYMGNGPLWNYYSIPYIKLCKDNWHWGLLYVQNYVSPESACLGQSWYLSADMQLFWVAPFFLYPMLLLSPSIGGGFILVVILIWAGMTAGLDYVNEASPNLFLEPGPNQFVDEYVVAYTRAGPWLVGVALGFLLVGIKANKIRIKLSKVKVALGWMCSTALCLGVLYGVKPFLDLPSTQSLAAKTTYMVLHRLGWSLGLSWVIFACVAGYGGPVNSFLSSGIFQILGKLSYCVFLIHMTIQQFRMGRLRTNVYLGDVDTVYSFLGDYMLANLLSIPLVLLFEIPIANLDRYFFGKIEIFQYPRKKKELILATKKKEEREEENPNPRKSFSNDGFEAERPTLNVISVLDIDKDLNCLETSEET